MHAVVEIPGLYIVPDFVSVGEEQALLKQINGGVWDKTLTRHVQHFGYAYSYTRNSKGFSKAQAQAVPDVTEQLADLRKRIIERLGVEEIAVNQFNQCIINKYEREQGIAGHVDNLAFGAVVVSVSLSATCNFLMEHVQDGRQLRLCVPRRSLLVLTKEARYDWKHGIPPRVTMLEVDKKKNSYIVDDTCKKMKRETGWQRISVTFRNLD